jgi:hypothetical protein
VVPGVGVLLVPEGGEHRVETRARVLLHQGVTQHRPARQNNNLLYDIVASRNKQRSRVDEIYLHLNDYSRERERLQFALKRLQPLFFP